MRVVLTGGAGFIGSNLAHLWARERPDDELVVLDALTYAGHRVSLRDLEEGEKLDFVRGDVADAKIVERTLRGTDLVLHLAAESHVDRSIQNSAPFLRTNVLGTHVLLEAARRAEVQRFLHVSTDEVFGSLPLDRPEARFTLESPYDPRSPYAASKAASDQLVRAYHHTYGLPVVLTNCGNNYGPYQHPEKLIPLAITRLLTGGKVPVYGDGKNVRDWIHVEDHARALELVARRGTPGRTYLVGARCERSNLEVVGAIARLVGRGEDALEHVADRPGHDRRYALDPSFLESSLGWRPTRSFEDGLASTVRWYREHPEWWRPLLPSKPPASLRSANRIHGPRHAPPSAPHVTARRPSTPFPRGPSRPVKGLTRRVRR